MNNFDELCDHDGSVEFVFLGDSYTHGLCVNSEDNIVERFRTSYPDALNLGMSSTGPGRYSIIFRSLMRDVDVRKVFVLFYEGNDLRDLILENANATSELTTAVNNAQTRGDYIAVVDTVNCFVTRPKFNSINRI